MAGNHDSTADGSPDQIDFCTLGMFILGMLVLNPSTKKPRMALISVPKINRLQSNDS